MGGDRRGAEKLCEREKKVNRLNASESEDGTAAVRASICSDSTFRVTRCHIVACASPRGQEEFTYILESS